MDKFDYRPGEYKILVPRLQVRGTPDTNINNFVLDSNGNQLKLTLGQSVPVYRIQTVKSGWIWGIISNETADHDHFICLWNLNTRFAELVKPFEDDKEPVGLLVSRIEFEKLKERVEILEKKIDL